jgi:hypothetical protein
MQLKLTNGHIVAGTRIDQARFVGRVKAAQLFQIAPDPRATETGKSSTPTGRPANSKRGLLIVVAG